MFRDSGKEPAFFQLKSLLVTHLRDKAFTPLCLPYKVVPPSRIAPSSDPAKNAPTLFQQKKRDSGFLNIFVLHIISKRLIVAIISS